MDIGMLRGLITLALFVVFLALVWWSYSRKRKRDFDEAARLPLADDQHPPSAEPKSTKTKEQST